MLAIIISFYTHFCICFFCFVLRVFCGFFLSVGFCFEKQIPHRAHHFLNSMSSFSVDSTCFSHLLFVYGSGIQESKACMAYAATSLSFQLNSAEEVRKTSSSTCTNRRSPYGSTCRAAVQVSYKETLGLSSNPEWLLAPRLVWLQPTFPKSCSDAPSKVQPLLPAIPAPSALPADPAPSCRASA